MNTFNAASQMRRLWPGVSIWPLAIAFVLGLLLAWLPLLQATTLLLPFVLLLIFIEPLFGVALMLLAAPWGALENVALGSGLLDSGQLLFLITIAIWLARSALDGHIVFRKLAFLVPLLVFTAVGAISIIGAPSLQDGIKEVVKWLEMAAVALIVVDRAPSFKGRWARHVPQFLSAENGWRVLLLIILLAGTSQALIGIWQFGLRGSGPEHFEIVGGRFFRAYGTFEQPNPFGGFMAWMAALGIGTLSGEIMRIYQVKTVDRERLLWVAFLSLVGGAALLGLIFSWSRGAWLGFAAGAAGFLLLWPRNRALGAIFLGAGLILALLGWQANQFPPVVVDRVAGFTQDLRLGDVRGVDINDANYAVLERLAHWQAALDMARYNLWNGVGFGNYAAAYANYALINWPDALGHAHNYYLNILAETGVPGFVAYSVFWIVVIWRTLHVISHSDWPVRGVALGLLFVWIALSIHHLLDKLYVNNLYLFIGAMLGVLQVIDERACRKV